MAANDTRTPGAKAASTLDDALLELDRAAPGAPLIHLGQSPFWDEPTKALIATRTERPLIAGIHDLDYFSRQRAPLPGARWQLLPRNDGTTRDIWIAAGELSALFGAETSPSRQALQEAGIRFDRLTHGGHSVGIIDRSTEAFGWRGIVYNHPEPAVICDLPASDAAPMFARMLAWGAGLSASLLARPDDRRALRAYAKRKILAIQQYIGNNPRASLSDLLMHMLSEMYSDLIGPKPHHVAFQRTRDILRFNSQTAQLPRFRFVEHFLDSHKGHALAAYGRAVEHSGVMDPASAEEGALPFEIYAPGRGRGTLHVTNSEIRIAFPKPMRIPTDAPIRHVPRLAEVLESQLGADINLFGKAITLPAMVSGEFVMVLTEKGSSYIPRTQKMIAEMQAAGIWVKANPLLRLKLRTWCSLAAVRRTFQLPPHLAQGFRTSQVTSGRISRDWKAIVKEQKGLLSEIRKVGSPCELVRYLSQDQHKVWFKRLEKCNKAQEILLDTQKRTDLFRQKAIDIRSAEDAATDEIRELEKIRGEMNRSRLRPLKRKMSASEVADPQTQAQFKTVEREGNALLLALESKLKERQRLREKRKALTASIRKIDRSARATSARKMLKQVEVDAEKARLELARNAIMLSQGLPYANLRPSAWWFPALDPSGAWFKQLAATAKFRLDPLQAEG